MGFRLVPREVKFFDLFDRQAQIMLKAMETFKGLALQGKFDDESVQLMGEIEHQGDDITHEIIYKLNLTFITPFDREDIHQLAKELDDVVDMLYTITKRLRLYKLNVVNDDLIKFSEVIDKSITCLAKAINGLRKSKDQKPILQCCIDINNYENQGDQLRDLVVGELVNNPSDPITVMKWKEIFEGTETILDICEDIANIIESILVKQG
ncbi:MAG: DUF47 family protein [Spirochaetes bacterium]|jgi:hypothetical protein|nr:DUF47 family protein [Spirochaetota bacterium]